MNSLFSGSGLIYKPEKRSKSLICVFHSDQCGTYLCGGRKTSIDENDRRFSIIYVMFIFRIGKE